MPNDDASDRKQVEFTPEFKRNIRHLSNYIKTKLKIILVTIYSKTEQGDISAEKIRRIISDFERSTQ